MLKSALTLVHIFLWGNSMADIDYNGIIKEIDGINPADNEDGLMQTYSAERLVELQTELSSVEPADRNDDHQLAWLGLYDKANALIGELAGQSLEGISKDQLQAYESLISNFASHVGEEYSGIAAELKGKLDARREIIEAESNQDVQESVNDEVVPQNNGNENQQDEDADIKDTVLDVDKQKFLDSINDENKEQITERFNKIDEVADEMGDVFAAPEDENAEDKFKGLRNFYDNLWIDYNSRFAIVDSVDVNTDFESAPKIVLNDLENDNLKKLYNMIMVRIPKIIEDKKVIMK